MMGKLGEFARTRRGFPPNQDCPKQFLRPFARKNPKRRSGSFFPRLGGGQDRKGGLSLSARRRLEASSRSRGIQKRSRKLPEGAGGDGGGGRDSAI